MMIDLISREDAIKDAELWVAVDDYEKHLQKNVVEWLKEFPPAEHDTDCISRQRVIEALGELATFTEDWSCHTWMYTDDVYNAIKQLPPIQPEIVRCKDCKHRYVEGDNVRYNTCELNHNNVQSDDWYCADAKRRKGDDMSRLISMEDAIRAIEEKWDGCCSEYPATQIIYDTTEAIERLPTIQPEITHEQAVAYLQSTGWMQEHDRQMMLDGAHRLTAQPEIVRCKDCKFWVKHTCEPKGCCGILKRCTRECFYCGCAERREVTT